MKGDKHQNSSTLRGKKHTSKSVSSDCTEQIFHLNVKSGFPINSFEKLERNIDSQGSGN